MGLPHSEGSSGPVCPPAAACVKFTPKIVIGAVEYGACVSY